MKYHEKVGSVFAASADYALAHCISEDAVMGAGIAPKFVRYCPGMQNYLRKKAKYKKAIMWNPQTGKSIVFNLITKKLVHDKPTYESLEATLYDMKHKMLELEITKLAIPLLGCGLDGLSWQSVKFLIKEVFKDTDIEVLVYFYDDWAIKLMEKEDDNN